MSKKIKELELDALRTTFQGVKDLVLLEPIKVDAGTEHEFRKKLRGNKVSVRLVKNSFARKILAENGVNVEAWSGPTMICWGAESVKGLATSVDDAVKEARKDPKAPEKFKVKAAVADGEAVSFETAKTMPTRLEAIGDVLGALLGPGSSIVAVITGPATELAGILKTIEEKGEQAPAA